MIKRIIILGSGVAVLVVSLIGYAAFMRQPVQCAACGAEHARHSSVKVPESAGGLIIEILFEQVSAPPNAYVCQRCVDSIGDRVTIEMQKRQKETAQQAPGTYSNEAASGSTGNVQE